MHCGQCGEVSEAAARFCGSCGSERDPSSPFRVGAVLASGRYRIDALLGEGGMGTVWRAEDITLGRTVALKCLAAELTAHPTARRRMAQEARVLARLESPNVVQVRNVFEEAGLLILELEYVAGGDLSSHVRNGGRQERDVLDTIAKTLDGLHAIHLAGLVHRDIKPANVLLDANGQPKVTDLGVAHDPTAVEKTQLGARLGTPEYMSPEQIRGERVDARSDVYAVGVMCYQLITGELPFRGTSEFDIVAAHVREMPDLGKLARSASPQTVAWVARALAKQPSDRWRDAKSMAASARAILAGGVVPGLVAAPAGAASRVTSNPSSKPRVEPHSKPMPVDRREPRARPQPGPAALAATTPKKAKSNDLALIAGMSLLWGVLVLIGAAISVVFQIIMKSVQ